MEGSKSNIDIINELEKSGALKALIQAGLFPAKILLHKEIYFYVDAKIKSGVNKTTAITWAHDDFGLSTRQIFNIMKSFQEVTFILQ